MRLPVWLGLWALLAMPAWALTDFPPQVELWVPAPPAVARVDGRGVLVYELHLTSLAPHDMSLRKVTVEDAGGRLLGTFEGAALEAMVRPMGASSTEYPCRLGPGQRSILYFWLPADPAPTSLRHRALLGQAGQRDKEVVLDPVPVNTLAPLRLPAPFARAGRWLAANGPSNDSVHRRTVLALEGHPWISQRFAIDWVLVDDQGQTFRGDPRANSSYYCYGAEVLAVAEATVAGVHDGVPDNVPGTESRAVTIDLQTVGGNWVALDLGQGRYAMYAHLQPGSLRVKAGDRVKKGQVLALLGNSGNSTEPHLHFHVATRPFWLAAEGLPYLLESFHLLGRLDDQGRLGEEGAGRRQDDLPPENALVTFP
ncbi:MAG TPA: M23 family metallopeptidase [Candidatus Nitrosotenuis sp.]|nr:M23 family metallopeptidase [Candidatus Nitrosotenuis sp.]